MFGMLHPVSPSVCSPWKSCPLQCSYGCLHETPTLTNSYWKEVFSFTICSTFRLSQYVQPSPSKFTASFLFMFIQTQFIYSIDVSINSSNSSYDREMPLSGSAPPVSIAVQLCSVFVSCSQCFIECHIYMHILVYVLRTDNWFPMSRFSFIFLIGLYIT